MHSLIDRKTIFPETMAYAVVQTPRWLLNTILMVKKKHFNLLTEHIAISFFPAALSDIEIFENTFALNCLIHPALPVLIQGSILCNYEAQLRRHAFIKFYMITRTFILICIYAIMENYYGLLIQLSFLVWAETSRNTAGGFSVAIRTCRYTI